MRLVDINEKKRVEDFLNLQRDTFLAEENASYDLNAKLKKYFAITMGVAVIVFSLKFLKK